jgi:Uma2 family endonuclease
MNRVITAGPPLPGTTIDPRYPDSDGRPMGDTEFHSIALIELLQALQDRYAADPTVYVATNLIWYYQEGDPKARKDPDILFARGVAGKHKRRSFRAWEEKVVPQVLFEVASKDTWRNDVGEKRDLYASLGVKEYFVFDPEGRYVDPVLQGWKSVKGKPVAVKPSTDGSLLSKELGLRLVPEGDRLRLRDAKTGEPILTRAERTEALAAELERLRARLDGGPSRSE